MPENTNKYTLLEDLDLSVYTFRQLHRAGIKTIEELSHISLDEISAIQNIGKRQVEEITQKLQQKGYDLDNLSDKAKNRYFITYKIEARYIAEVNADSLEKAMEIAESKFLDADFGAAEDIDGEAIIVEDEKGNYVWEKGSNLIGLSLDAQINSAENRSAAQKNLSAKENFKTTVEK